MLAIKLHALPVASLTWLQESYENKTFNTKSKENIRWFSLDRENIFFCPLAF